MTLLMSFGFSLQQCHEESGWCFDQQVFQAFYLFHESAVVFDYALESSTLDEGDVIAAFKGDQCVGFYIIDFQEITLGGGVITVPLMGSAPGEDDGYLEMGDIPDFVMFDVSNMTSVCVSVTGDELVGFAANELLSYHGLAGENLAIVTGNDQDCDGCAFYSDNDDTIPAEDPCDCQGPTEYCDCTGQPIDGYCSCSGDELDCLGECGGDAVEDCLGECGGDAVEDCLGECGGIAEKDCYDVCDGNAFENECGCVEGSTGLDFDCCFVCNDAGASNGNSVGMCGDEQVYDDINGNGQYDIGEEFGDISLCVPEIATDLTAIEVGGDSAGEIQLNWSEVPGNISHYEILRIRLLDENGIENDSTIINTNNLETSFIDQNLFPNTEYEYKVRALHSGGLPGSEWSAAASAQTSSILAPQIISVIPGELMLEINIQIDSESYNDTDYDFLLSRRNALEEDDDPEETFIYNLSYRDRNLNASDSLCYKVKSIFNPDNNINSYNTIESDFSQEVCGSPNEAIGWTVTVEASIQGFGVFHEDDLQNYLGMSPLATDGFDSDGIDFPEPPPNPGNFIQLYFPHDDWIAPYSDFTQDIREYRELSEELETWNAEIVSNMDGPVELEFKFNDYGEFFGDTQAPIKFPIYVLIDGVYKSVEMPRCLGETYVNGGGDFVDFNNNGQIDDGEICHEIIDNDSCYGDCSWYENVCLDIEFYDSNTSTNYIQSVNPVYEDDDGNIINDKNSCESQDYNWIGSNVVQYESIANEVKNIDIIVGNLPPQIPSGLSASLYNHNGDPAAAWVLLEWDGTVECCQTIESRYPATHYYIYRILYGDEDNPNTSVNETNQLQEKEFINNCLEGEDILNTYFGTYVEDENGEDILIDENYCKENRYDYMGIVYADQFSYIDSTLNIRAIPFLDKIYEDLVEDYNDGTINRDWLIENSRYVFETDFRYVITAVNEKYTVESNSLPTALYGYEGVESFPSDTVIVTTRENLDPITSVGDDVYAIVPHDNFHMSMEPFQDTGIDGQPNTYDFLDYGLDGLMNQNEPGYHPRNNKDPNGDDYDPGTCSNQIYSNEDSCENAGYNWTINLDGTEGNYIYGFTDPDFIDENGNGFRDPDEIGEPGENDGQFTFLDYGSDRTPSHQEDGYDPDNLPDPNGDDWHPNNNPNGTEGNFKHDPQEYSEQFSDIGCDGCGDSFEDSNGNGCWDSDEECTDIDGNEICDVAACNGLWDGNNDYVRVFLDGSGSSDPEYGSGIDALDFDWQQISGPNVFLNTKESKNFINCGLDENQLSICEKNCNGTDEECEDYNNWFDNVNWKPEYGNDDLGQYSNQTCDIDIDEIIKYLPDWQEYSGGDPCYYGGGIQPYFDAVVPNGEIRKDFVFELRAKDTYLKGWPPEAANHSYPENVNVFVFQENNDAPIANINSFPYDCDTSPLDVFCEEGWECDYTVSNNLYGSETVCFDWANENNIPGPSWRIPHDGDPETNVATIGLLGGPIDIDQNGSFYGIEEGSYDVLVAGQSIDDEIFFTWSTGKSPEPYNDLNQNGVYDLFETFFDLNSNGVWDSGDPYSGSYIAIDREADSISVLLTVTDTYGAEDTASIEIKVLHEQNSKPIADAGSDQTWYIDEFSETHTVSLPYKCIDENENGDCPSNSYAVRNMSYDPDILGLFDCGVDGLCDEDEEGFSFYGLDGLYDSGDEIFDPARDGCFNPFYRSFTYSDCVDPDVDPIAALEGNNIYDDGGLEYIDYDQDGEYTPDLGDGFGEEFRRDQLSYRWYQSGNSSDFIEGSTISVDLEPGTYLYYLEVCDAYNGYPKNEFIPIPGSNFGTWNETTYDGCALDSVTVTILDEQPPSKPVLDQDQFTHSLYSMSISWSPNDMEEECLGRDGFAEECRPGFVDEYKLYRNGQLINTYKAWVDGNGDGIYELSSSDDRYIDCYFSQGGEKICELVCDPDDCTITENFDDCCEIYDNWSPNDSYDSDEDEGNNQYDPDEPFFDCYYDAGNERFRCSDTDEEYNVEEDLGAGIYNPGEEFIDCYYSVENNGVVQQICTGDSNFEIEKANGRWDDAEYFIDCNSDLTICVGDPNHDPTDANNELDGFNGKYDEGEPYVDSNSNGQWDDAEKFNDCNYDSTICCDCENFDCDVDVNGDGVIGDNPLTEDIEQDCPNAEFNSLNLGNGVYDAAERFEDWNGNDIWNPGDIFYPSTQANGFDLNIDNSFTGDYIRSYPGFEDIGIDLEDDNCDIQDDNDGCLEPDTEYCYFVTAINSSGISSFPSNTICKYTAMLPTITILSPNGAEIFEKGKQFGVEWVIEDGYFRNEIGNVVQNTDVSYVDSIFIEYRIGESTYTDDQVVWYTGDYKNLTEDNKAYISIYKSDGIPIAVTKMNDVELRLTIKDVAGKTNYTSYQDITDNKFTITPNMLDNSYPSGWSLIGSPLNLKDEINCVDENQNDQCDEQELENSNDIIDMLGTDQNLGNFGTDWYIYNENGEFPLNSEDSFFAFDHGKGYILSLFQQRTVSLEGGVVEYPDPSAFKDDAKLRIHSGWNLISNMLVSTIDKDKLWIESNSQHYSWDEAVNFGFVQSEIHGWNNNMDSYTSVDSIGPWTGYWLHASRELDLKFRPHIQQDIVQRENRSDVWSLNLVARGLSNGSAGDFISVGFSDSANTGFKYGEDEYDIPVPLGDKYIDLFFDRSDWAGGPADENGNSVSEVEFYRDIRPYSSLDEPNYWQISTNTYADEGVDSIEAWTSDDEVQLSWNQFDAILGLPDHNIFLHIDDQYFDMKIEESVILSDIDNREIIIQIGGSSPLAYDSVDIPTHFSVSAAYPNPFNPIANLDYAIPNSDNVKISIFNVNGQLVETLLNEFKTAGYHTVKWNAYNISSGLYFIKVESGQNVSTQKLMLMK